jgi:TonB family protein
MRLSLAAVAALMMITATAGQAAEPRPPTGKWVVNFDAAQCIASRNYGTAKVPFFLVIKAPPVGNVIQLAVMLKGRREAPEQLEAKLIVDQRPPLRASVMAYTPKGGGLRAHRINLPSADFMPLRQAKSLEIQSPGLTETFALSQMEPLLKTMEQCVADLRTVWNVADPTGTQSKLKERAKGNIASFVSNDDYPAVALDQNQTGIVAFALLIDEAGKVADCTVIETSGAASLDSQSCAVLRIRAKFTPAVGADGKPAKDALVGKIRWQIVGN